MLPCDKACPHRHLALKLSWFLRMKSMGHGLASSKCSIQVAK